LEKIKSHRKIVYLRVFFIIEIYFFVLYLLNSSVNYQDKWILAGLEIPYLIYIVTLVVLCYYETDYKMIVFISILSRSLLILIPNIKYSYFLGRNIDQHNQFNLANVILNEGYIADKSDYFSITTRYYIEVPLLHMSMSLFSIVTGMPLYLTFKILPVIWNFCYPLITYYIAKNIGLLDRNHLFKLAMFLVSFPTHESLSYIVTGSLFVYLIGYLYVSQIIKSVNSKLVSTDNLVLFILFTVTSILSHSIYTIHLLLIFIFIFIVIRVMKLNIQHYISTRMLSLALIFNITWIAYQDIPVNLLSNFLRAVGLSSLVPAAAASLSRINLISIIKIFILFYGLDIFMSLIVMFSSIYFIIKKPLTRNERVFFNFMMMYIASTWILTTLGLFLGITYSYWIRVFTLSLLVYPFMYGLITLSKTFSKYNKIIMFVLMSFVAIFSTIQYYDHPLFIPKASLIYPDASPDEPIVYRVEVNSIYQRNMISYAEQYADGRIACDKVTRNQIIGLTDRSYWSRNLLWYFPLDRLLNPDMIEREYDYFLIHLPGVGGAFEESGAIRNEKVIRNYINYSPEHDIIFSNGVSYILLHSN
jgi:hypothetical protein